MFITHLSKIILIPFMFILTSIFLNIAFAAPVKLTANNSLHATSLVSDKRIYVRNNNYVSTWHGAYHISRRDWGMDGPHYIGQPVKILYPPLHSTKRPYFNVIDNY